MNSREDLIKRLREAVSSDHARGCEGRQYACDCGHDLMIEGLLEMAADEIERNAVAQRPLSVLLQARSEDGEWVDVYPAQIEALSRQPDIHLRAVETAISAMAEAPDYGKMSVDMAIEACAKAAETKFAGTLMSNIGKLIADDIRALATLTSTDQRDAARVEVTDGSVQQGDIITYALTDEGLGKIISHARPVTSTECAPGHTHMMVTPESLDAWLEKNPLPECTCGADDGDPLDHHDISCPAALSSTECAVRRCQKCGSTTQGEEAWVDGHVWCHPCADRCEGK